MSTAENPLTAEQILARENLSKKWGGHPEVYYGHIYNFLQVTDRRLRKTQGLKSRDEQYLAELKDKILERMTELGLPLISFDICGYEDDRFELDLNWRE